MLTRFELRIDQCPDPSTADIVDSEGHLLESTLGGVQGKGDSRAGVEGVRAVLVKVKSGNRDIRMSAKRW
jgi:hypothetical protein